MDYKDILEKYKEQLPENIKWWPNFLYHFTDVHNVPSILYERYIWSRWIAEKTGVMQNDNASHAVIEATESNNKCYGRLYFRPLTPTQYHNEGYKPMKIRNSTINANCPVPVFLCLSANATLNLEGTCYAEKGISGNRSNIQSGIDAFGKLNFSKIFHDGSYDPIEDYDIKEYRQSEVIRENGFPIEPLLKCILCRSEAEREMLLFLLGQYSARLYNTYKNKIIYNPKLRCFYNHGIYVKKVSIIDDVLKVELNDSELRIKSSETIGINVQLDVTYWKNDGTVIDAISADKILDYRIIRSCNMKIKREYNAEKIRVKVLFDGNSMYENEISLEQTIIF